jgi:hypothetical protein
VSLPFALLQDVELIAIQPDYYASWFVRQTLCAFIESVWNNLGMAKTNFCVLQMEQCDFLSAINHTAATHQTPSLYPTNTPILPDKSDTLD